MEKSKFDSIISDQKSIKFEEGGGQHFLFEKENLVISFSFIHKSDSNLPISDPESRIALTVSPLDNLSGDMPLKTIGVSTQILVNADNHDYALTFLLKIDMPNRKVKVMIEDLPEMGQNIVTDEERNGIEVPY